MLRIKTVSKDVTDVKNEPANRIDPLTGYPYSIQSDITLPEFKKEKETEMERLGFAKGTNANMINLIFLQKWHRKNFTDVDEFKGTLDKQLKGQTVSMRLGTFGIDGKTYILPTYAKGIGKILPVETFIQDIKDGKIIGYKTVDEAEKQLEILRDKIIYEERKGFAEGGKFNSNSNNKSAPLNRNEVAFKIKINAASFTEEEKEKAFNELLKNIDNFET